MAMGKFSLLINILGREFEETYLNYYKKNGVNAVFSTLCLGTASKSMLDYLGLERNEKVMLSSLVSSDGARKLLQGLVNRMGICPARELPLPSRSAVLPETQVLCILQRDRRKLPKRLVLDPQKQMR